MPEDSQTSSPSPSAKSAVVLGLSKPFTGKDLEKDGVDAETGLFHGVDPEKGDRVTVTLPGLQAEFGEKEGAKLYVKIAGIKGGSVFFNPATEATSFRPPLGIGSLGDEDKKTVLEMIANAKPEKSKE